MLMRSTLAAVEVVILTRAFRSCVLRGLGHAGPSLDGVPPSAVRGHAKRIPAPVNAPVHGILTISAAPCRPLARQPAIDGPKSGLSAPKLDAWTPSRDV
jgi:hypothetical protein